METEPYSILVEHRPCRVAYLVDSEPSHEILDDIIRYSRSKWGGRYFPIIPTDGKELTGDWWSFLRQFDPDVIKAVTPLDESLRAKIQTFVSPLIVEQHDARAASVRLRDEPLGILPNKATMSRVARDFIGAESALVLFELTDETPAAICAFVDRNFGLIDDGPGAMYDDNRALTEVRTLKYRIATADDLGAALLELGDYRRVVFPSQLCTTPNYLPDSEYSRLDDAFVVHVGDAPIDVLHSWNRAAATRHWLRTALTQLWLPRELAVNSTIRRGLTKFLNRFVDQTGNQNRHEIHFQSCTLDADSIKSVVDDLGKTVRHPRSGSSVPPAPKHVERRRRVAVPRNGAEVELYRGRSDEEHLLLEEPNRAIVPRGDCWFADVYIQYRPERFRSMLGTTFWWRLPARNSVLSDTRFFNRHARVNSDGFFSVKMQRQNAFVTERGPLVMRIPSDQTVAWALLCGPPFDQFDKPEVRVSAYSSTQSSDKGLTLRGVLGLFPDLLNAHHVFEQRLWRGVFAHMANQNTQRDETRINEIQNALRKHRGEWEQASNVEANLRSLAERALNVAKTYAFESVELQLDDFVKRARKETIDHNDAHGDSPIDMEDASFEPSLRREVIDELSAFVELGVLHVGIRPKCPSCGFRIWYGVDDLQRRITCSGCGATYAIRAEESWSYQLNSLVRAAVSRHGTIPVLLVIGQLMRDARSSFLFVPPTDLFAKDDVALGNERHVGDLDIVAVVDGQLVIGEVKTSTSLFKAEVFNKTLDIAKAIRPGRLIFSALEGELSPMIEKNLDRLRRELEPLEVAVEWYAIRDWVTAPSPLRWPA